MPDGGEKINIKVQKESEERLVHLNKTEVRSQKPERKIMMNPETCSQMPLPSFDNSACVNDTFYHWEEETKWNLCRAKKLRESFKAEL